MPDIYGDKMTRCTGEAQRLDDHFDLLTTNIGYLVKPHIAATLPPNARVADIGTGTGHFLEVLQQSNPDAVLDGYDISTAMYPATTPANINLKVLDIKQPVPEELHGKYNLVHARLLVAAILPDEWMAIVQNLAQLVKPGGWMQWEECDFISSKYLRGGQLGSSSAETLVKIAHMWREEMRERFQCGWSTLPADMRAAGLISVESDCVSSDRVPETRKAVGLNGMVAILYWLRKLAANGVPGSMTADEVELTEKRAREEIDSGAYVRFEIYVTSGQKKASA
ncbi:hypothetical protein VPNG_01641 [Cytospora leucostoma]|uniref:Methyltransferase domain-containing protein n=1 Tax=Cytospora leucostoma TaxID=1230097 RepID=A0A423XJV6_9PEZI|nr:hypothetical protein VPNG_01641 [Cytospora leucostoma]